MQRVPGAWPLGDQQRHQASIIPKTSPHSRNPTATSNRETRTKIQALPCTLLHDGDKAADVGLPAVGRDSISHPASLRKQGSPFRIPASGSLMTFQPRRSLISHGKGMAPDRDRHRRKLSLLLLLALLRAVPAALLLALLGDTHAFQGSYHHPLGKKKESQVRNTLFCTPDACGAENGCAACHKTVQPAEQQFAPSIP